MGVTTADSGSVGAFDTGLWLSLRTPDSPAPLAMAAAGHVSSYMMTPEVSVTCMPISSDSALDSAMSLISSTFHSPARSYPSASFSAATWAISLNVGARVVRRTHRPTPP